MSLRDLQKLTGLDRGYLSRLERGLIREPDTEPVRKVAAALAVPPDAITQGEDVTAKATAAPPTRAKQTPSQGLTAAQKRKAADEIELVRWTPEEVVDKQLLPYRSVRVLKQRCYRRQVIHHNDGGRITFTSDDIRRENERTAVTPIAA